MTATPVQTSVVTTYSDGTAQFGPFTAVPTPIPVIPAPVPTWGISVDSGWAQTTTAEAAATILGLNPADTMFADYWAAGGYPWKTIPAAPFPKLLETIPLFSAGTALSAFRAQLAAPNSPQLAAFVAIAQACAAVRPNAIWRLGAEPEGSWEPWYATADPADYSAILDIIIPAVIAVAPSITFQLDVNNGWFAAPNGSQFNPALLYSAAVLALPAVKYIGMDTYAEYWGTLAPGQTLQQACLNQALTGNGYGLEWLATFAAVNHLQVGIAEFGPSIRTSGTQVVGSGDDPAFVTGVLNWFKGLGTLGGYLTFFDVNASDGNHQITGGSFPNALAAANALVG